MFIFRQFVIINIAGSFCNRNVAQGSYLELNRPVPSDFSSIYVRSWSVRSDYDGNVFNLPAYPSYI